MTKLFVLGATGYIGGDALYVIANAHPEYEITCLVRNSDKGAAIATQYSKVKLVYGDLDSADLIEEESKKADIVLNFAHADHEGAARTIVDSLQNKPTSSFYIHTSGTGILLFTDIRNKSFGSASNKVYNDWTPQGIQELTSLPDDAPHRNVDKVVLAAGTEHADKVHTAIVSPCCIYGPGRGPSNQRSMQIPELSRATLERGHGIVVGEGKTRWGNVHVHDLSDLYLKLTEEAAAGGSTAEWPGKPSLWGKEGYYLAVGAEHAWSDIARRIVKTAEALGFVWGEEVKAVSAEEADQISPWASALWGANSRAEAVRAKELLRWQPKYQAIEDEELKRNVLFEAQRLGLKPGHAKVAAGDA
ncbi:hypothetical protein MBLNU230_g7920t1 [Neophaeotheca triangularis]